ncbi:MAG: hypothetical protein ACRERC_26130, partial [Candidatus Binatia bacterium]
MALLATAAPAQAGDPLNAVRAFCQADGQGARLAPGTWPSVGGLVAWALEPAWDHVNLIRGYEVSSPQQRNGAVTVEVKYTLSEVVRSTGVASAERVETRTYVLEPSPTAGGWRLRAPAPPPYVFANQVDAAALAALLEPGKSDYVSNSAFVWQLLKGAGWELPYADVAALATAPGLAPARTAQVGDLVLYYDGDTPYHVGVVESDDQVVSATINAGIRRAPFAAFA